ncbi:hypothetical protein PANDA_021954 [Ailuropoda melanoleuca]|uniref:Kinesin motor domain-containing protein n=1 Tax=Ailuropoda melanoleuca TaxID=9646 RepID=D2I7M0_AILME|nr:hypothetical protein PANDA_021954 [Ailuropoda melanoleuca]
MWVNWSTVCKGRRGGRGDGLPGGLVSQEGGGRDSGMWRGEVADGGCKRPPAFRRLSAVDSRLRSSRDCRSPPASRHRSLRLSARQKKLLEEIPKFTGKLTIMPFIKLMAVNPSILFPDREFLLRVSYMEIYNETITDLVCDTQKMKPLIVREDFNFASTAKYMKNAPYVNEDYEQLRRENEEMELKLKEKKDLDEFEALERKAEKDQEESTEDLKQMKQTLLDAETVALDAKKESAFLRSENLELKEKMLSPKSEELQQNTTESQKRLNELEDLKEQLESRDSRLQTMEKEKTLITEQLQQTLVEVRTLIQEKEDLKQLQKSLQIERDQLKSDTRDTVNMERRCESLKYGV